jgi:hypothetical protein
MTANRLIAGVVRALGSLVMAGLLAPAAFAGGAVDRADTIALAAQATHYSVTSPTVVPVSVPLTVTVTALDASNATATGYSGTAHFTTSSNGTLPADYTFVAGDNGAHTFSVILMSPGPQTIIATDTVNPSINGTDIVSTMVICPPGPAPYAIAMNSGPACAGGSVNLFATGSGSVYSWTGPDGFTSTQRNPAGIIVAGVYAVRVTDPGPCGGSAWAWTTVVFDAAPPAIIRQPVGQIVSPGSQATFTVAAASGDLHYQWFVRHPNNAIDPVGTDSPSFTTRPEGNASWFVRIANACGTVDSVEAAAQVGTTRHRASH